MVSIIYVIYLVWALVPDETLISLGIHFPADKHFVLAFPVWLGMTGWFYSMGLTAYGMLKVHPRPSYKSMQDYASLLRPV